MKFSTRPIVGIAVAAVAALALSACTPGAASTPKETLDPNRTVGTDVSAMGELTLTVWDQEVRGGQNEQMEKLNAAFETKYPNITIDRVSQSFDDLGKTLRLALSGKDAPDVVQANNARNSLGAFVAAGQLHPFDAWVDAYKWEDRFSDSVLAYSRYSEDGTTFGSGSVYALPQVGEVVGVFYSKKKLAELGVELPTEWSAFEASLKTAKDAGEVPMLLGNIEKWPAGHVFGPIQGAHVAADQVQSLGFGNAGASWETAENVAAASTLDGWMKAGYFNDGVNGTDYDAAWQELTTGNGVYLMGGSWLAADLQDAMGDDVGFFAPSANAGAPANTTGGTGLPFAITTGSKNPDLAAAYIDFITNDDAMAILAETGNLPVNRTAELAPSSGVLKDVYAVFGDVTTSGVLLPYLDYATPTMGDTLGEALQGLIDGQLTPDAFTAALQSDYGKFTSGN
ncbi:extracellular solute-binding protein [Microterricola viridarii]|uniref:Carbohydrate ABC transporter substrate-binding protein, CUT1 family n=1 Tax=Microterricola viridarii TaxID=412690 RepID=A0A1H1NIM9_9MICO|nr:extracellular solute-binding protein [Microterricola viridarii]SDR98921.1 carbohydrate ABC transporter substrate-binding protein, CUT1 family [Microterricola viridarii]